MKVIVSFRARMDMINIGRSIAKDNPARARSFVDELLARCLSLETMFQSFEAINNQEGKNVRRRPYGNYLIIYEVQQDRVDIMRVMHGSRNYHRSLFPVRR